MAPQMQPPASAPRPSDIDYGHGSTVPQAVHIPRRPFVFTMPLLLFFSGI